MELKTISQKLRGIRKTCGFTQQQVAAVLNVDRSTYTYYEIGKTTPDIRTVKALADLFNVSVDELLMDEEIVGAVTESESDANEEAMANGAADLPETANKLTRAEREVLLYYRALSTQDRQMILQEMRMTLHAAQEEQN